jgi:hypothetical protein
MRLNRFRLSRPHPEERAHPSRPSGGKAVANGANGARVSRDSHNERDTPPPSRDKVSSGLCLSTRPSSIRGRGKCRARDAPAASRAKIESTQVSHHGHTGNTRHSPRDGFNGLLRALPGDRLSCHHPRRDALGIIGRLTSASRCQDHTASPSALTAPVLRRRSVHRIPHPTSVTIAKRPSSEAGWRERCG